MSDENDELGKWLTPQELVRIENFPSSVSAVHRKAKQLEWMQRKAMGVSGRQTEYLVPFKLLPSEYQEKQGTEESPYSEILTTLLTDNELEALIQNIKAVGIEGLLVGRRALKTAQIIDELPEESVKEILLLINEAQYCALAGIPFNASKKKGKDIKRA
ncbi:hypothetical protein ACPV5G_18500 [Photobacterium damselae]|uniref:hypothetical protein n=1 Tax=Photobacterium damselae TaxID=38293 RepID=UPI0040686209